VIVTAPASSANLGPGFDALALAVDLPFRCAVGDEAPDGFHHAEPTHPAAVAFVEAGGAADVGLWWHSPIPPGRGLGFSGAARVAGAAAARLWAGDEPDTARDIALDVAARLEGHADNAAASARGGFVVAAAGHVVALAVPADLRLVVWSPAASTSTEASRRTLPEQVPLVDAAANIGRTALWVAAVAVGEWGLVRAASVDRIHQDLRLAGRPDAAAALATLVDLDDVLAAWLSGSGPSVAALVPSAGAERVAAAVRPSEGPDGRSAHVRILGMDTAGVRRES
jgi:homoserine kinase